MTRSLHKHALLGLLGSPIKSSASPFMHESAGEVAGIRCHYQLIDIAGADKAELERLLYGIRHLGFSGINVTFPYKEMIVGLLDDLSPAAKAIGAVNCVIVEAGKLIGYNTDATGFQQAIAPFLCDKAAPIALIGAGGVGKAIAFALHQLNMREIRLYDTDKTKMQHICTLVGADRVVICNSVEEAMQGVSGLINATPLGMAPNMQTPVPNHLLHSGLLVSDVVYSPLWTPLLLAAKACGATTMTGRDLAVFQAAHAFKLFTKTAASFEVMAEAFDTIMHQRVS